MKHKINSMVDCYEGDAIKTCKQLPSDSVQCVVTSPPYYGLRDYSVEGQMGLEATPEQYIEKMVELFREIRRVLRDDGTVWLNLGDSYASSGGKTQPHRDSSGGIGKKGTRGEQPYHSAGGGFSRPCTATDGIKPKDLIGVPWRVAFALQADGWYLRQDIIWHKPNPMPESVRDRCTKAHEYVFLFAKSERYFFDSEAIKEPAVYPTGTRKDAKKGSFKSKYHGDVARIGDESFRAIRDTRNKRSVWTISTKPFKEAHFAVMPPDLAEICIKAGTSEKGCCPHCGKLWVRILSKERVATRPGNDTKVTGDSMVDGNRDPQRHVTYTQTIGWKQSCNCPEHDPVPCLVLDPFGGAATTGLVASKLGRRCTLIELNPQYIQIMKNRLVQHPSLFDHV